MNMDFNCVGCFSCVNFENRTDQSDVMLRGIIKYWCNKDNVEVRFLNRDSCHCVGFKLKDGYSNQNSCTNCFEFKMCNAINKYGSVI